MLAACAAAGRDAAQVKLVAVSKTQPVALLAQAMSAGQVDFGESYADELSSKKVVLTNEICWHFIGRIQSNKARDIAATAHVIHSVDRMSLVAPLARGAAQPVEVLVQVNSGGEASKGGCLAADAWAIVQALLQTEKLLPVGLMTIPPPVDTTSDNSQYFKELRFLRDAIAAELATVDPQAARRFVHLSMGMSDDLEVAIAEGATMIRVGTAIFGPRRPR